MAAAEAVERACNCGGAGSRNQPLRESRKRTQIDIHATKQDRRRLSNRVRRALDDTTAKQAGSIVRTCSWGPGTYREADLYSRWAEGFSESDSDNPRLARTRGC